MSLEQYAFINKTKVPSREQWQEAIDRSGYRLILDPELKPFEDSGFVPCKLNEQESGFEIYYEEIGEYLHAFPHLREEIGKRNYTISFRWGADMAECACVLIASLALTNSFEAVIYYPDDDMIYNGQEIINEIEACLKEI